MPTPKMSEAGELTVLLRRLSVGDSSAEEELMERVYAELKRLAARFLRGERGDHTLQPTALVHEAFVRLCGTEKIHFTDRNHFFAVAAQIMRRLLVDHSRKYHAQKRGGGKPLPLDDYLPVSYQPPEMMEDLGIALERLALTQPRQARVVEMRYFGGMSIEEIAEYLKVSTKTVKRDWVLARAMLYGELSGKKAKKHSA